jgi:hypothetical protein
MTVPVVDEAVRAHRAGYWQWIEANAVPGDRDILLRLRDHWRDCNARYFAAAMTEPYITLTEPSKPSLLGQCCAVSSWGSRLEIRIRPSLLAGTHPWMRGRSGDGRGRYLVAADVLMHECIHQLQMEITGRAEPAYHGHGPGFTARAVSIGAALGLPPVVPRRRGTGDERRAAQWPHNVRPADYYLGAWQPPESVPVTGDTCPRCHGTERVPPESADAPQAQP